MKSKEIDIEVKDLTTKKITSIYLSPDDTLSNARKQILLDWDNLSFVFLKTDKKPLGKGAEAKKMIQQIVDQKNVLTIQSEGPQLPAQAQERYIDIDVIDILTDQKIRLYLSPRQPLEKARTAILVDWCGLSFSFICNGEILGKAVQDKKPIKDILIEGKKLQISSLATEKVDAKQNSAIKKIIIDDREKQVMMCINTNESLDELRKQLRIEEEWKNGNFSFVHKDMEVSISSEKVQNIEDIMEGDKIFVKKKQEKKKNEELDKKKEMIGQTMEKMKKMEEILQKVDDFSKKYKDEAKLVQKQQEQSLKNIKQMLKDIKIEIAFTDNFNWNQLKEKLLQSKKDSAQYLQQLENAKHLSLQQLIKYCQSSICCGYLRNKKATSSAVDINKIRYDINRQVVSTDFSQLRWESFTQCDQQSTNILQNLASGEIAAVVATPAGILNAGGSYQQANQKSNAQKIQSKSKTFCLMHNKAFVGEGVTIEIKGIKLNQDVINGYTDLFQCFLKYKYEEQKFIKPCIKFFERYGWQIQHGDYMFGGTYSFLNKLTWKSQQSLAVRETAAEKDLKLAMSGALITTSGIGGAKANFNMSEKQGNKHAVKDGSEDYQSIIKHNSHPYVKNKDDWLKLISMNNSYWKMIGKHIQRVPLYSLMEQKLNLTQKLHDLIQGNQQKYEKFTQAIEEIMNPYEQDDHKGINSKDKDKKPIVVLLGNSGVGKSTFGNQLIGINLHSPFKTSDNMNSQTKELKKEENTRYKFLVVDTPGLRDNNCIFQPGELERKLLNIVNLDQKPKSNSYKKINAFLIITKPAPRIEVSDVLQAVKNIFGSYMLQSVILVFNIESSKNCREIEKQIMNNPSLLELARQKNINLKDQIFINYRFDHEVSTKIQWAKYQQKQKELLQKISHLCPFTSIQYQKYLIEVEKEQQERNKKAQAQMEELIKKKDQERIQKIIQENFRQLAYFQLQNVQSPDCYIKFGPIFTLRIDFFREIHALEAFNANNKSQEHRLYLVNGQITQNGNISGFLQAKGWEQRQACPSLGSVGYRFSSLRNGSGGNKLTLEFVSENGLLKFCQGSVQEEQIYWYQQDGILLRGNVNKNWPAAKWKLRKAS